MDWWQLVLLLFVIAGYVIKHILAAQQEQPKPVAKRDWVREAQEAAEAARTDEDEAREKTELDRRIEVAMDRRRSMAEPEPTAAPKRRQSIPMPVPTVIAKPVPRYQPPSEDRPFPEIAQLAPRSERPVVVRPAPPARPAVPVVIPVPVPARPPPARPARLAEAPAVGQPATVLVKNVVSPAVGQVLELLKNPQSLAAAVVLREILDRPVSRRRR